MTGTSEGYERVFEVYWPIGAGVLVLITLLVVAFVWRFRARRDEAEEFPGGTDERTGLELAYAGVLTVVAAFLVWLTFDTDTDIEAQFDEPADVSVDVTAARWNWRFAYPEIDVVEQGSRSRIPTLHVPAGEPVDFTGTSLDVQHSFWIPEQRFKRDLFAERETSWQFTFAEPAFLEAGGICAEFCGLRHAQMRFNVEVMEPAEFDRWAELAATEQRSQGAPPPLATEGQ